jgi:hypothetical protein
MRTGAGLVGVALLAGCGLGEQSYDLRYRLTIEVDTPQGLRTGSGVIERSTILTPVWGVGPQTDGRVRGEAIPIDLPNGQTIFALLGGPGKANYAWDLPGRLFLKSITKREFRGKGRTFYDLKKQNDFLMATKPGATLTGDDLPLLVRFKDIGDPLSVESVDPGNFAQSLGNGYSLRRVTLRVTDEPVTSGIIKRLPWLDQLKTGILDGAQFTTKRDLANNLSAGSFRIDE